MESQACSFARRHIADSFLNCGSKNIIYYGLWVRLQDVEFPVLS
jgi:hypothetical protein